MLVEISDIKALNAAAEDKSPESAVLYGWLVDGGMGQVEVAHDELEATVLSVYEYESYWDMTITPIYQNP